MKHLPIILSPALLLLAGTATAGTLKVPRDFPTIQEAVTAAQPGDVIDVSAGYYRENVTVTTSGITLTGRNVTIDGSYAGTCLDVQADDVTITGLEFVNGGIPATTLVDGEGGGLNYVGNRAFIVDCEASSSVSFGIRLLGNGAVKGCVIAACLGPGLFVDTDNQAGEHTVLSGNAIYHCATGIEADDGPFLFSRNIASNNTGDGINLTVLTAGGVGAPTTPTEFTRNKLVGNGGTGLRVLDEVGAVSLIEKSAIEVNAVGLDLTGAIVRVVDNDINLNRAGGVFLKTSGATLDGNTIRRNSLCGIEVVSFGGAADGTNTLTDNKVDANGGDGIHVSSGANVIDHNFIRDNKGDGLQVLARAVGNTLINNKVHGSQHDGIDNWGTGTFIMFNTSKANFGADLAGIGAGSGTVDASSSGNSISDESGLDAKQELELETLAP